MLRLLPRDPFANTHRIRQAFRILREWQVAHVESFDLTIYHICWRPYPAGGEKVETKAGGEEETRGRGAFVKREDFVFWPFDSIDLQALVKTH